MNKVDKYYFLMLLISILFSSVNIFSQNYIDGAESVAYDSLNNRYLVSSLNNSKIISIDKNGNQSIFKESIGAFGNCIIDSVLYVTGGSKIRGLNVFTAEDVFSVSIPGVQQFDGITYDDNGNLYVLATIQRKVYKVNLKTKVYSVFVNSGFGTFPQDLIYDKFQNRILACQWHANSSILAIDLEDSVMTVVAENTAGFADGITIDQSGNVYVTQNGGLGEIYKYDNNFSKPGELIYVGIEEPAGLDYNIKDNVLAVPSFRGDTVVFIKMPATYLFPKIEVSNNTGNAPLIIKFADLSSSSPKINKWEWDFDNDGIIDSYEQNPEWEYKDAGVYKIKVNLISDSLTKSIILEDSICVFNGESSLNFLSVKSIVKISPTSRLNLKDEWTFEAWINPRNLMGKYIIDKSSVSIYTNKRANGLEDNSLVVKLIQEDNTSIRFTTLDSSLTLKKWQHIALSYSYSKQKMEIFIDGKLQELNVDLTSIFAKPIKDNESDTLLIGNNITGLRSFTGNMDEIRIWNRALNKEELDLNRFKYLNGSEDSLVAYWNLNEGFGEMILDLSSNVNNGDIIGAQYDFGIDYNSLVNVKEASYETNQPNELKLYQNYPNPFNPSTIIQYTVAMGNNVSNVFVTLKIYDILGRELATLVNEEQTPGKHNVKFDASFLSSGFYIYKITADQYSSARKMLLIR